MASPHVSSVDPEPSREVAGGQRPAATDHQFSPKAESVATGGATGRSSPSRYEHHGHRYERVNIQDYARVQFGDTHIQQQHFHPYPADEDAEVERQRQRDRLMKGLAFNMMETRLATIGAAHTDTCRWLLTNERYLRWPGLYFRSSHHGFLWIRGKPGAGKSTLMKGHNLERTTEGMYRSLLHQLYAQLPQRCPRPIPAYPKGWVRNGWPLEVLQDWLRKAILQHGVERKFICYVDALDECEEDAIRQAIANFEALGELASAQGVDFTICFASRHYPNISINYNETINLDIEQEHQEDIAIFVRKRLRGESALSRELGREISWRCSGVFLWAALVVQTLNENVDHGATRSQLLNELKRVPSGIDALLRNMVRDCDPSLLPLLQLVLCAERPLTIPELYHAMNFSSEYQRLGRFTTDETTDDQMRSSILTTSRGLVEFTERASFTSHLTFEPPQLSTTVQFIHETVRVHLLNGGLVALDSGLIGNVEAHCHARLGRLCQNHIEALLSSDPGKHPFLIYSMRQMLFHMERAFLGKALDLNVIDAIPQRVWLAIRRYADGDHDETYAPNSLYIMVRAGREELALALLRRQSATDTQRYPANNRVDINAICGSRWDSTVLMAALNQCSMQLVESILQCHANPNFAALPGYFPILAALGTEKSELQYEPVKLLLQHGADPNCVMWSSPHRTPLALAVKRGSERLVDLLLRFRADPNGERVARPLCLAVVWSPLPVVVALLAAGARVNDRNERGRNALHEVVMRKGRRTRDIKTSIACMLLDAGTDVQAMDDRADSPVTLASKHGRVGLVKLFFDRGADPNVPHHIEIFRELRVPGNDYSADYLMMSDSSDDDLAVQLPTKFLMVRDASDDDLAGRLTTEDFILPRPPDEELPFWFPTDYVMIHGPSDDDLAVQFPTDHPYE